MSNTPKQFYQRLALTWRLLLIIFFSIFFGFIVLTFGAAVLSFESDKKIEGEYLAKLMNEYEQKLDSVTTPQQARALFDLYSMRVKMYRESKTVQYQMDNADHSRPVSVVYGTDHEDIFAMRFTEQKAFVEEHPWQKGTWIVVYRYLDKTNQTFVLYLRNYNFYRKSGEYNESYLYFLISIWLILVAIISFSLFKTLRPIEKAVREQERITGELQIAHHIQEMMLPKRRCNHLDSFFQPARETGGDFFDYVQLKDRIIFIIADVSGKGMPASLVMATNVSRFRLLAAQDLSPKQIIEIMNREMTDNNPDEQFMTAFVGSLARHGGIMTFCNAGHNAPVLVDQTARFLDILPNLPLGVMENYDFVQQQVQLPAGSSLFCYTDGLNETVNESKQAFGDERILATLNGVQSEHMIETMMAAVRRFAGKAPQEDDLTLFCLEVNQDSTITFENIEQTARLHGFLDNFFREESVEPIPGVELAIEELLVNALQYSGAQSVSLKGEVCEGEVVFTLTDEGVPFDPLAVPKADTSADIEQREIGGLGILLATELMDSVTYKRTNNQNIVTLCKSTISKPMVN